MIFFVSRQCYWPEGKLVVEIACGGLDYANPDMMVPKFRAQGEGEEYQDPREAVEAALQIRRAWAKAEGKNIRSFPIAYGSTGGVSLPFDPCTQKEAEAWAERLYQKLPKCDECGGLLGKETWTDDFGELTFCREYCAEKSCYRDLEAAE